MNPIGLLAATVALVVYPGGATLALLAGCWALVGQLGNRLQPQSADITEMQRHPGMPFDDLAGCLLAGLAVALLPLPSSPAAVLPPGGTAGDLGVVLVLLAAAVACVVDRPRRERLLDGLAMLPVFALAAVVGTLSVTGLLGETTSHFATAARGLAAVALLLAIVDAIGDARRLPRAVIRAAGSVITGLLLAPGLFSRLAVALPALAAWAVACSLITMVLGRVRSRPGALALAAAGAVVMSTVCLLAAVLRSA